MFPWSSITHPHIDQSSDMLYIDGLAPIFQSDIFFSIGVRMSVLLEPIGKKASLFFFKRWSRG